MAGCSWFVVSAFLWRIACFLSEQRITLGARHFLQSATLSGCTSLALRDFSSFQVRRATWQDFDSRLRGLLALNQEWTMILEDPLANSFIAPATDNPEDDHQVGAWLWPAETRFGEGEAIKVVKASPNWH
jgi:hypothetical protein